MRDRWRLAFAALVLVACTTEFDPALLPDDGGQHVTDAAAMMPCPAVRLIEGTEIFPSGEAGPAPPRGVFFRDPTFGTCLARVSFAAEDGFAGEVVAPRRGLISSDGRSALALVDSYDYHLYDLDARAHVAGLNLFSVADPRFAADDPRALYYVDPPFTLVHSSLDAGELETVDLEATVVGQVPDATGISLSAGSTSMDDSVWALRVDTSAGDGRAIVTLDSSSWSVLGARALTDTVTSEYRNVRVAVSPSGAFVAVGIAPYAVGPLLLLDLYSRDLQTRHPFSLTESDDAMAWDFARSADGRDVLVFTQGDKLMRVDLEVAGATPVAVLGGLGSPPLDSSYVRTNVRVSGAATERPGWVVLSFASCRHGGGSPCAPGTIWAQDKIVLVSIDESPRVLNLAWHRSTRGGGRHPAAIPSRDLTRIVFQSDWEGSHESTGLYMIELPEGAIGDP